MLLTTMVRIMEYKIQGKKELKATEKIDRAQWIIGSKAGEEEERIHFKGNKHHPRIHRKYMINI